VADRDTAEDRVGLEGDGAADATQEADVPGGVADATMSGKILGSSRGPLSRPGLAPGTRGPS
jgi:hypothetical protein